MRSTVGSCQSGMVIDGSLRIGDQTQASPQEVRMNGQGGKQVVYEKLEKWVLTTTWRVDTCEMLRLVNTAHTVWRGVSFFP